MSREPKTPGKIDSKTHTKEPETSTKQHKDFALAPKVTSKPTNTKPNYTYNKRAFGRPSKYRPKYCQLIIDYFTRAHTEEIEETHTNRKGETWSCYKLRAVPVPTLQGFSAAVGVPIRTLADWANNFKDFSQAYSHAQALQLDHLSTVTGLGLYNSNWAVFMAKNVSDWRDKKDVEHSGDIGLNLFVDKMIDAAGQAQRDRASVLN